MAGSRRPTELAERPDVLVVGGGGSGLAAAVSAAEHGLSVLLVEKQAKLGGTTALSVGSITAAGTRLQQRAGIKDDANDFLEDMYAFRPELLKDDAPALRALLARNAGRTVSWLEAHGVAFVGPYLEAPHRIPRMHNVIPNSRAYIERLAEAARRLGVQIRLGVELRSLLREDGRVTGAGIGYEGVEAEISPRYGTILATGDFSGNEHMRQQYLSAAAAAARPINAKSTGDAQRLAAELGARLERMDMIFGPQLRFPVSPRPGLIDRLPLWRRLCSAEAFFVQRVPAAALRPIVKSLLVSNMSPSGELFRSGAVLVNETGARFCDEAESTSALAFEASGSGYIVFDSAVAAKFNESPNAISTAPGIAFAFFDDYRRGRPDLVFESQSLTDLASRLGMDSKRLSEAGQGRDWRAPYFAMGPVFSALTVTEGGLCVDEQLRVLDGDGAPIDGLHAVGSAAQGGMQLLGHGHHIAWAMTSGMLAGAAIPEVTSGQCSIGQHNSYLQESGDSNV